MNSLIDKKDQCFISALNAITFAVELFVIFSSFVVTIVLVFLLCQDIYL